MRESTPAYVGSIAAIAVHAVAFFFGAPGIAVAVSASMTFCFIAWIFYRRALKKLSRDLRGLSYDERMAILGIAGVDAEAQRDFAEIDQTERRKIELHEAEQKKMSVLRPTDSEHFPRE